MNPLMKGLIDEARLQAHLATMDLKDATAEAAHALAKRARELKAEIERLRRELTAH